MSIDRVTILNIVIAAGGAAMVAESTHLLHLSQRVIPLFIVASLTFGSYWFLRARYFFQFHPVLVKAFIISLTLTECLFCFGIIDFDYTNQWIHLTGWHVALLLPTLFVVVMYSRRTVSFPLRKIPYLKVFIIAYCWAILTVLPAVLFNDSHQQQFDLPFILLLTQRFIFVLALALLSDVIDVHKDNQTIKTLPMLFGIRGTYVLVLFLVLISDVLLCLFLSREALILPGILSVVPALFFLLKSRNKIAEFAVEGAFILHALIVFYFV